MQSLDRAPVAMRPVEACPGQQLDLATVDPGVHAVTVVFDLVQPVRGASSTRHVSSGLIHFGGGAELGNWCCGLALAPRLGLYEPCSLAYLLSGYRRSATSCSQLAAVTPSGHLRGAEKLAVRLIVVSDWMPLLWSPIQTRMPAS